MSQADVIAVAVLSILVLPLMMGVFDYLDKNREQRTRAEKFNEGVRLIALSAETGVGEAKDALMRRGVELINESL